MTPKEKAKDLFDKMYNSGDLSTFAAKKCALRAVEELINQEQKYNNGSFYPSKYWQQVEKELNNIII